MMEMMKVMTGLITGRAKELVMVGYSAFLHILYMFLGLREGLSNIVFRGQCSRQAGAVGSAWALVSVNTCGG